MLVIIGCSAKKRGEPSHAREMYLGRYFKSSLRWAESVDSDILILSAKFGLIPADVIIEPYDVTWRDPEHIDTLFLRDQANELLSGVSEAIVMAGSLYLSHLRQASPSTHFRRPFYRLARARFGRGTPLMQLKIIDNYLGVVP